MFIISIIKKLWAFFSSVYLTISLAVIICVVAAIGSVQVVGEQKFYQAIDKEVLFPWLLKDGLEHMELTLWIFILIFLMTIFGVNTFVCTTDKVYSIVKGRKPFKALFPHFVHIGFFIALMGHLVGSVAGFKSDGNILFKDIPTEVAGVDGLSVRLDEMDIEVDGRGRPTKLASTITILKNSEEVAHDTVTLNGPLIYKGIAFYHSGQGRATAGLVLDIDGESVKAPFEGVVDMKYGKSMMLGNFYPDFALMEDGTPYTRSGEYRNPHIGITLPD
ncbi:MAG: cytochrome c biogenesis protein ResB, partial [Deltaproteobacteria bacterium]|nr:cytochrome c biogenesis protein ResB [Deltaproteobacteria bacterium]